MNTVANIANASPVELLCITYEIFLDHIKEAISNTSNRREQVAKAREVIAVLTENLDFSIPLSKQLFQTYVYVQKLLVSYNPQEDSLKQAYQCMEKLYKGYKQIAESETSKMPVMQNAQNVYAGMTYGKGYLNEVVVEESNRGFKV